MRILFVTARPPWPSRRGDQARTAGWVRELGRRHELSVVALRPPGFPPSSFPPGVGGRAVPVSRLATLAALPHAVRLPGQVALHVSTRLRRAFDDELERGDLGRVEHLWPAGSREASWRLAGTYAAGGRAFLALEIESAELGRPLRLAAGRWEIR